MKVHQGVSRVQAEGWGRPSEGGKVFEVEKFLEYYH